MTDSLYVLDDGDSKKVEDVEQFAQTPNEVIVDFDDGTNAVFDEVWGGYSE